MSSTESILDGEGGRTIAVDDAGVVLRHPLDVNADGTQRYQHALMYALGGDPVYFKHGDATIDPADVLLPGTLLGYITVVPNADATTYRTTLNAENFDYVSDAGDNEAAVLAGIAAVIDADADWDAEVETGTARVAVRSATDAAFTISVATPAGGGTMALTQPVKKHAPMLPIDGEGEEWTSGQPRTALVCAAGESASVYLRYYVEVGVATRGSR